LAKTIAFYMIRTHLNSLRRRLRRDPILALAGAVVLGVVGTTLWFLYRQYYEIIVVYRDMEALGSFLSQTLPTSLSVSFFLLFAGGCFSTKRGWKRGSWWNCCGFCPWKKGISGWAYPWPRSF